MKLHPIQQKLLDLANVQDLDQFTLRGIGSIIGVPHPQQVKHHLQRLWRLGLVSTNIHTLPLEMKEKCPVCKGSGEIPRLRLNQHLIDSLKEEAA